VADHNLTIGDHHVRASLRQEEVDIVGSTMLVEVPYVVVVSTRMPWRVSHGKGRMMVLDGRLPGSEMHMSYQDLYSTAMEEPYVLL
jgi:hypothetical protein